MLKLKINIICIIVTKIYIFILFDDKLMSFVLEKNSLRTLKTGVHKR